MSPFISIIIPVYNREYELNRALKSLVLQDYKNFEVVVCDDGSTIDLQGVVRLYDEILNISYVRIDNSGGPAKPRNVAIKHSKGQWLAFLDSDDWWDANRLSVVSSCLTDDTDFVYHSLRIVDADSLNKKRYTQKKVGSKMVCEPLKHMAFYGNPIPNSSVVIRRDSYDLIDGISEDPGIIAYEDFDAWLRLLQNNVKVKFIDLVLGSYWVGSDSISAMSHIQISRQMNLFKRHYSCFEKFGATYLSRRNYVLGCMYSSLPGCETKAYLYLRDAINLPTIKMRVNRFYLLFKLFNKARKNFKFLT